MKVSIIIPAYNASEYIRRCIDSIVSQIDDDCEIIVVDDGSTDDTLDVLKALAAEHPSIVVLHKENGGVSSARNLALTVARGELISFIDADDWVLPGYFDRAVKVFENLEIDYCKTSFQCVYNVTAECSRNSDADFEIITPNEITDVKRYRLSIWGSWFRRQIIVKNALSFNERMAFAEDQTFNVAYFEACHRICYVDNRDYCYYINPKSATKSPDTGKLLASIVELKKIINNNHLLRKQLSYTLLSICTAFVRHNKHNTYKTRYMRLVNGSMFPYRYCMSLANKSERIYLTLLKLNNRLAYSVFKAII